MSSPIAQKRCRLEFNNSGSWKTLGHFDVANGNQADTVMNLVVDLLKAMNEGLPEKRWPSLRISRDDDAETLAHWTVQRGVWFNSKLGSAL